ncbi:MAG TPA: lipase family protein [Thermoleophilaceae bacterium]|nr:lipase family protein [Thermoleophilaceae bacterium]
MLACAGLVAAAPAVAAPPGKVVSAKPLRHRLWIPGTTSRAFKLTYVTTNARGKRALSSGMVFVPKGKAPRGGWPVISWAHGTSGLGDKCAPSRVGPALPHRDRPYLANWMREGYAIVASDYVGLGTPGLPAYLNGRSEAHNIVDIVKAGRSYLGNLSRRWVVIGQSQGAGASIYTARYATQFGGRGLDYLGAVGTGTPAGIEAVINAEGPGFLELSAATNAYFSYIYAGLRASHPELGLNGILTPLGRTWLKRAETECVNGFEKDIEGVQVSDFFTRSVSSLPHFVKTVTSYMAMPEKGFDKPFFMGHGTKDTDVPYALTFEYVKKLKANHQPLTFKKYNSDHSGTLLLSQKDTHPFVRKLFRRGR